MDDKSRRHRITAFLINLDRSPERLRTMAARLDGVGLPWRRVPAVEGRDVDVDASPSVSRAAYHSKHGKELNPAEVGCYLSHVKAIRMFLDSDAEYGLILEDDADFPADFPALLAGLLACDRTWDVVKLSGRHSGNPVTIRSLTPRYTLCVTLTRHTGAAAYLVNRHAAERYSRRLEPMELPYDHAFDKAWQFGFRFRVVYPVPCNAQTLGLSTISYVAPKYRKFPWYRRGSVLLYRTGNEVARVLHGAGAALKERLSLGRQRK